MREAGHEVLVAITLREAYLRISEGGIDAVVVDSYDPRVGVVDLARSMNALPDAPPLVLVSASPYAPEISARIGAAAFLAKPCESNELLEVVDRLASDVRPVRNFDDEDEDEIEDEEPTGPIRNLG